MIPATLICLTPEWLTAIGTLGLAVVAFITIFRDEIRELIRHPEWQVDRDVRSACSRIRLDFQTVVETTEGVQLRRGGAEAHWIRVRIRNVGEAGAKDVEAFVTQVRQRGEANRLFVPVRMDTPWSLTWKDNRGDVLARFPVGAERVLDIGHVVDPTQRSRIQGEELEHSNPDETLFCLSFAVKSNTGEYLLGPGEYEIDFRIFAANAKPSSVFTFSLNHTGRWFLDEEQMYRDGLGMSLEQR